MMSARTKAGPQSRLFAAKRAPTAAKEMPVWPEGKESSPGRGIRSWMASLRSQGRGQHQPGAPGLRDQQQDQGQGDPDLPVVAEGREEGQHRVQKGAAAALLDAVQDAELQCLHGILPAFRAFCPFLSLMIAQDRDFGKSRSLFQGLKSPVSVRRGQEAKISASAAS